MKNPVRLAATMLAAAVLGACGTTNSTTSTSQPFKAAWIYVGTAGDHGWTQAHDDGRKMVEQQLGTAVKTTFKENVPEGPQEPIRRAVGGGGRVEEEDEALFVRERGEFAITEISPVTVAPFGEECLPERFVTTGRLWCRER